MKDKVERFADGEARCTGCGKPLPACETWPGHRVLYCCEASCKQKAGSHPYCQFVEGGTITCKRIGCGRFVQAGCYDRRHTNFACSGECWRRLRSEKNIQSDLTVCACGCGESFRPWKTGSDRHFKDRKHAGRFKTEQALQRCGLFLPLVREYLEGFARIHYTNHHRALTSLVVFCEFLVERGISTMDEVSPKTITEYLIWGKNTDRKLVAYSPSPVSVFFNWQIAEGRRTLANPVVPSIHKTVRNASAPRPLADQEVDHAWELLGKRGDPMLRLAMAIGLESGLRISEMANIRLVDVDQVKQRIHVRIPTKTKRERFVPYGERTRKYLEEWLHVRDLHCGHDHLLLNKFGGPASAQSLRLAFVSALTRLGRNYYHKKTALNPDGFDSWSTHRLRHTMSSSLVNGGADASAVMAIGGWSTFAAMCGYVKVDPAVAQHGYDQAMKRAKQMRVEKKPVQKVSLSDLAKQRHSEAK